MNEFREDITSGEWIIVAPGRSKRPMFLEQKKPRRTPSPKATCPFEDLQKSGNWPPIIAYPNEKNWRMVLIPNKYPALIAAKGCAVPFTHGIYKGKTGVGAHELLVTRDHNKSFFDLSEKEAVEVFKIFQMRYQMAAADPCNAYAAAFMNWGPTAGASLWHPHYQILVLPIVPPHVAHSVRGAEVYFKKHKRCVRCDIIKMEKKEKVRIVEENEHALAFTPYASMSPFDVRIVPKKHYADFSETPPDVTRGVALLTRSVLRRIRKYVNDPDLNVFIHSTPFGHKEYRHHHWHIEVSPKVSIQAGFELSTGININVVDPDAAAAILRGKLAR